MSHGRVIIIIMIHAFPNIPKLAEARCIAAIADTIESYFHLQWIIRKLRRQPTVCSTRGRIHPDFSESFWKSRPWPGFDPLSMEFFYFSLEQSFLFRELGFFLRRRAINGWLPILFHNCFWCRHYSKFARARRVLIRPNTNILVGSNQSIQLGSLFLAQ